MTDPASPSRRVSRRTVLQLAGIAGAGVLPLSAAAALPALRPAAAPLDALAEICRTGAPVAADGAPIKLKLAWNASGICTAAAPVAHESGIFARHGLEVEFVNFGGSTEALLEAIATGKADAGIGMALRWLKPLEQGFDVKVTAGIHGGCLRLLAAKDSGITTLADLKGKTVAVSDQASPGKNFFSIALAKAGLNPETDVEWRQYPGELLPLAIQKGEAQALADADPKTFIWLKDPNLVEVATNLSGEYKDRTCCLLAVRGSLVRDERPIATALTKALLEAGHRVATDPRYAAEAFAKYGGKGSIEDLAKILTTHDHGHRPIGDDLKRQLVAYGEELKLVNVFKPRTDLQKFADRVYADVLTAS
ncbi:ABC transporter substrate-binding protein [Methylopila sp. Yamaguchi]|uniref:ABC transporter substrate-binding protein n=1 Tax=Methylopila sp. Yamaguchi TaxID=1437817 RepID=UPI000CC9FA97|nr:ABC transporter substrate-binding protein [Methylopila sp. Yamaguchi]GBD46835.1 ABC transporter substrate-binding protein [Methylopila sp. Yamaguchi]